MLLPASKSCIFDRMSVMQQPGATRAWVDILM